MKYILPEGIDIEKVVVVDKKSLCMKPDLKITPINLLIWLFCDILMPS